MPRSRPLKPKTYRDEHTSPPHKKKKFKEGVRVNVEKSKRDRDDDEDEVPVKKKKALAVVKSRPTSKDQALALMEEMPPAARQLLRRALEDEDEVGSMFQQINQELMDKIGDGSGPEEVGLAFQRSSLAMVISLIPLAENKYRESRAEHAAYALGSLVSQGREIIADMEARSDKGQQGIVLVQEVIQPMMIGVAQNIMNTMHHLKKQLSLMVPDNHEQRLHEKIDDATRSIARYLQEISDDAHDKVKEKLGG